MSTEKTVFDLDVNAKGFISGVQEAKKTLSDLGKIENISELLGGFKTMGLMLGAVGASVLAVKAAFDMTLEGEKLEKINNQFNILSKNAGIVGSELKEALEKGAKGLIDDSDLLEVANKGIVALGKNSMIMGQTLELAMKIAKVSTQDAKEIFEALNTAVASGNMRMLRQYGIIVDSEKALRTYAKAHGQMVSDLGEEEKKRALANEALRKAEIAYRGIETGTESLTSSTKRLGVQWNDFKEAVSLAVEKVFKPVFIPIVNAMTDAVHSLGRGLKQTFGSDAEKNAAGLEVIKEKIASVTESIEEAKKREGFFNKFLGEEAINKKIAYLEGLKAKYVETLNTLEQKSLEMKDKIEVPTPSGDTEGSEEKKTARIKFEADLLKLSRERVEGEIRNETDLDAFRSEMIEKRSIMEMELYNRLRGVDEVAKKEAIEGTEMVENQKLEIRRKYAMEIEALDRNLADQELRILQQAADQNKRNAAGFAAGWKVASKQAANDFMNFSTLGQKANAGLTKSLSAGFKAMGDGSENAAEAMKKAFLGAIGDEAIARGEFLLGSSLFPPNPLGLAAGGALVALGAKLKSLAGGGGSSIGAGGGGGGGSFAREEIPSTMATLQEAEEKKPQKAVTIQVQGNYFETEQTKRTLMEMIRAETDATSFSYVQINQGGAQ